MKSILKLLNACSYINSKSFQKGHYGYHEEMPEGFSVHFTGFLLVTGGLLFPDMSFLTIVFSFVLYSTVFFLILKFIDFSKKKYKRNKLTAPCKDCEVDTFETNEWYMVADEIWNKVVPDDPHKADYFLCVGCIEKRLGRQLVKQDFPMNLPINTKDDHSERLQSRIEANN